MDRCTHLPHYLFTRKMPLGTRCFHLTTLRCFGLLFACIMLGQIAGGLDAAPPLITRSPMPPIDFGDALGMPAASGSKRKNDTGPRRDAFPLSHPNSFV